MSRLSSSRAVISNIKYQDATPSASFFSADLHLDLCVVHARIHVRHVVNAAIVAMKDPGPAMIGDLELLVGDAGLLVAIATIRANESHVFVVDDRDADVELIDPVDNELDIWPSHVAKLDSLPDLHVEAVRLLGGSRAGKQHADDDRQEYLSHFLAVAEQETRRGVKTRPRGSLLQWRLTHASYLFLRRRAGLGLPTIVEAVATTASISSAASLIFFRCL